MSSLTVYDDARPGQPEFSSHDAEAIATRLAPLNVRFERWTDVEPPARGADQETVLGVYRPYLDKLMGETGAGSADVISIDVNTPNRAALREKFLSEHIHSEDEVRFFVHGQGHFVLHVDGRVYDVGCTQGDLISVPTGIPHWFDAGETPDVVALRIFTHKEGWIADYTGDDIALRFPAQIA
ncbi:1,2-dihydroxy-3-keto-5-methylthiopentene dioxygenase [Acetobacter sp.]|jgi:1,2-dihydroxy-3-keto-5-methylthiopentene dioxygenase|uniref:1,2-dihydroxy-3-keto-5-methylthiopentene dioxygenase n=1 Tax=Acetobacter sp. TaxID=440 RepID=UPI0025C14220|nr:cupin domain-containing protein [Acetobacter sp.]MCH4091791.1 cupin domain-containing protein [Acetobacter sp.]MCI1300353.1 cupin domain-containing protein [Acetobacter sp.]MCI1316829.1 cupin domain-containing protein [Acetobacter sp.]